MEEIDTRPIHSFSGYTFYIPSQQRGYRWRVRNVLELVEDLLEFKESESTDTYCLQPLAVVEVNDRRFKILDGQQRLTTLFLISRVLGVNSGYEFEFERDEGFAGYSRKQLLEDLGKNVQLDDSSIDNYYITKAYLALAAIFTEQEVPITDKVFTPEERSYIKRLRGKAGATETEWLRNRLLGKGATGTETDTKEILFIWYKVSADDEHKVFRNLNSGKINLSNSDLIKALLLSEKSVIPKKDRTIVALQFERMLMKMKDDRFWHMLQRCEYERRGYRIVRAAPKGNTSKVMQLNRIDLLFNLVSHFYKGKPETGKSIIEESHYLNDALVSFRYFHDRRKDIDNLWKQTYKIFLNLIGLYDNPYTYHYAGFLTYCNGTSYKNIADWLTWLDNNPKDRVIQEFRKRIGKQLSGDGDGEYELPYYSDKESERIRKVLLLHNIETILTHYSQKKNDEKLRLQSTYEMFPFDLLYRQSWDIEHISSQKDANMTKREEREAWFNCLDSDLAIMFGSMTDNKEGEEGAGIAGLRKEIQELKDEYRKNLSVELFNKLYQKVISASDMVLGNDRIEDKDRIGNLCLLDSHTNRSYHNSLFPTKRLKLIAADGGTIKRSGDSKEPLKMDLAFIPVCTRRVFTKYYNSNPRVSLSAWTVKDAEAYEEDIKEKLSIFINDKQNG